MKLAEYKKMLINKLTNNQIKQIKFCYDYSYTFNIYYNINNEKLTVKKIKDKYPYDLNQFGNLGLNDYNIYLGYYNLTDLKSLLSTQLGKKYNII